jgi:hypothetical protein
MSGALESRRDSDAKPRVARNELPWVNARRSCFNLKEVAPILPTVLAHAGQSRACLIRDVTLAAMPCGNCESESRRDSAAKPRVARNEQPWVTSPPGLNSEGVAPSHRTPPRHNPYMNAPWMRIRFASENRQQMSTSRVTKVTPWATAANPPIRTNSTRASMSRRVDSLRFCISLLHRGAQRIGEPQRIVIGQHSLPGCFCQAVLEQ